MWSVHTRNETTSRRCTPTCRLARARPAGRGGDPSSAQSTGRKAAERGPQGGPRRLASTRVIRQPHRCRRCRRAPTSTMRLVLSHTQGVSRPHILLLDAARRTPERGERPRAVSRGDLRANVRERTNLRGTSDRATRERVLSGKMRPTRRLQRGIC